MVKAATPYDSRLLLDLVKATKNEADSLKSYTLTCEQANNALNGWAAADTGDSPDVLAASNRVCELFDEAFEEQKTYLQALSNYRSSLKDVAAREAEIRVILRDRDIFVSRLAKLNHKKVPTKERDFEEYSMKLEEARAELAACESTLKAEERALVGVKRRIFREALRMRMRAMAQLGDVWRSTADRAIEILDTLEPDNSSLAEMRLPPEHLPQPPPRTQIPSTPHSHRTSRGPESWQSPEGSVIAPSHSASQVARRAAGYPDDISDDGLMAAAGRGTVVGAAEIRREPSNTTDPIAEEEERGGSSDEEGDDRAKYQVHVHKPLTPAQIAEQKARERAFRESASAGPVTNGLSAAPAQPAQPTPARLVSPPPAPTQQVSPKPASPTTLTNAAGAGAAGPLLNGSANKRISTSAPTPAPAAAPAPAAVAQRIRETQEERQKRFSMLGGDTVEPYNAVVPATVVPSASTFTIDAYKKKTAPEATLILPSSDTRTKSYRATSDSSDEEQEVADTRRRRTVSSPDPGSRRQSTYMDDGASAISASRRKLHKGRSAGATNVYYDGSNFDDDDRTERGGSRKGSSSRHTKSRSEGTKHSGGLFGGLVGLFKKRDFNGYGQEEDSPRKGGWSSRTDDNVSVKGRRKGRRDDDSDSDRGDPRTLVKVVNNAGRARPMSMTFSEVAPPRSVKVSRSESANVWVPPDQRPARKAMSDVGGARPPPATAVKRKSSVKSTTTVASAAPTTNTVTTVKKKKARPVSTATTLTYDSGALVQNVATGRAPVGRVATQNPAQRVTRDTPSLMAAVAPRSQSATISGMSLPSAKNPSGAISQSVSVPVLGTLPAPSPPVQAEPLKKKKSVKKTPTASVSSPNLAPATTPGLAKSPSTVGTAKPASILSTGSRTTAGLERRKSVRLASDTKLGEATYENSGGPANIPRPTSPPVEPQPVGILKESSGFAGEWNSRIGRDGEYSSDEEGDEYAKIRAQMARAERDWSSAGYTLKGKGRAY